MNELRFKVYNMTNGIFEKLGLQKKKEKTEEKMTPTERRIAHQRRYEEICNSLKPFIPEWRKEIEERQKITMPYIEFTKKMGPVAEKVHSSLSYWDAKKCLLKEGILFGKTKKDHEQAILIAMKPEYEVETAPGIKMIKWPEYN